MGIKSPATDMGMSFSIALKTDAAAHTRHREDEPHQHTGAVDAQPNSESGNQSAEDRRRKHLVSDILRKNVKARELEKAHGRIEIQQERHSAARKSAQQ